MSTYNPSIYTHVYFYIYHVYVCKYNITLSLIYDDTVYKVNIFHRHEIPVYNLHYIILHDIYNNIYIHVYRGHVKVLHDIHDT